MNKCVRFFFVIGMSAGCLFGEGIDKKTGTAHFSTAMLAGKILKMYVSFFNNPYYWFEDGVWRTTEQAGAYVSGGDNEVVSPHQFNVIRRVHYYRYKGIHPLDSGYFNTDADFLKRFYFYRFTGKTLIPEVDVYLFALDTETGLIFSYAMPTRFEKVWGHRIPRDWVVLDAHPYVQEHYPGRKFYEFDPVGFVQHDGKIMNYEWIIKQSKQKAGDIRNYIPHMRDYPQEASQNGPGYSPYKKEQVSRENAISTIVDSTDSK